MPATIPNVTRTRSSCTGTTQDQPLFNKGLRSNYDHHVLDPQRFLTQLKLDRERMSSEQDLVLILDACIENYTLFDDYTSGDDDKIKVQFKTPFDELKYIIEIHKKLIHSLGTLKNIRKTIRLPIKEGDYDYDNNLTHFCDILENKDGCFPAFLYLNFKEKFSQFLTRKVEYAIHLNFTPDTLEEDEKIAQNMLLAIKGYREELSAFNFHEKLDFIFDGDEKKLKNYLFSLRRNKSGLKMASQVIDMIENLLNTPELLLPLENYIDIVEAQKDLANLFSKESDKEKLAIAFNILKEEIAARRLSLITEETQNIVETKAPAPETKKEPEPTTPPPEWLPEVVAQQKVIEDFISAHIDAFNFETSKQNLQKTNPLLEHALFLEFRAIRAKLTLMQNYEKYQRNFKVERESMYENYLGWEIGTILHNLNKAKAEGETPSLPENPKAKPLYKPILKLQQHAKDLLKSKNPIDKAYGRIALDLANELSSTAHEFFDNSKIIGDKSAQEAFKRQFDKLLDSKKALMSEHRYRSGRMKKILADIIKGLFVVFSILGMPLYAAITRKNPFRLFYHHSTKRLELLDGIGARSGVLLRSK